SSVSKSRVALAVPGTTRLARRAFRRSARPLASNASGARSTPGARKPSPEGASTMTYFLAAICGSHTRDLVSWEVTCGSGSAARVRRGVPPSLTARARSLPRRSPPLLARLGLLALLDLELIGAVAVVVDEILQLDTFQLGEGLALGHAGPEAAMLHPVE